MLLTVSTSPRTEADHQFDPPALGWLAAAGGPAHREKDGARPPALPAMLGDAPTPADDPPICDATHPPPNPPPLPGMDIPVPVGAADPAPLWGGCTSTELCGCDRQSEIWLLGANVPPDAMDGRPLGSPSDTWDCPCERPVDDRTGSEPPPLAAPALPAVRLLGMLLLSMTCSQRCDAALFAGRLCKDLREERMVGKQGPGGLLHPNGFCIQRRPLRCKKNKRPATHP